jgi:hypothetical protein
MFINKINDNDTILASNSAYSHNFILFNLKTG